jgi:predicted RNA binding protein YcfA (HicA-like mRNA interferase family)
MRTSDLTFASLRSLLLELGFVEKSVPGSHFMFEHAPSDTVLVFRPYRPQEKVNLPDLASVRTHLDQRDLLRADAFDNLLRKASA